MNILFASQAIDGHFNPMTGVAMKLKERGHDVRWYTGPVFAGKLQDLGIPLVPFKRAVEHRADNLLSYIRNAPGSKVPVPSGLTVKRYLPATSATSLRTCGNWTGSFPSTPSWWTVPC